MSKIKQPVFELDEYELEIEESIDRSEWKSVDNLQEEIAIARQMAKNFFKKDKRINIRLTSFDLRHLKMAAAREGLPYQTLIASVLHKYAAGHLNLDI